MADIEVKRVLRSDWKKLQNIGRKTFEETFKHGNTEENIREYLETDFSEAKLQAELDNPNSEFHFVTANGDVVGYLKVNFGDSQTELKDSNALEIERIYVKADFHGKKVGQVLFDKAIEIAKQMAVNYIWLGVWEKNPRAIQFYKKNGFEEFDKHLFKLGEDEQTDIMMRLNL